VCVCVCVCVCVILVLMDFIRSHVKYCSFFVSDRLTMVSSLNLTRQPLTCFVWQSHT